MHYQTKKAFTLIEIMMVVIIMVLGQTIKV